MGDEPKNEGSGFWGGVFKGSFSEEGGGLSNTAGQIVGGFIPGTGLRDAAADVGDMWNNGMSWGKAASFGINIFSEVPLVGDAAKVLWKGGKAATEVGQAAMKTGEKVLEKGAKAADDVAEQAGKLGRETAEGTAKAGARVTRKARLRQKYMGGTPGKNSKTGKAVQDRMRKEGKLRDSVTGEPEFKASNGNWYPLEDADMAHKGTDAVSWWNKTGRQYGAKSPEVRDWMKDPNNYELDLFSLNRSAGGKIRERYQPPLK